MADSDEDYWVLEETEVVRVHVKPRLALFTPTGTGCPVELTEISEGRSSFVQFIENGEETLIIGNWKMKGNAHMKLEGQWKGLTRFTRVKPGEEDPRPPTSTGQHRSQSRGAGGGD